MFINLLLQESDEIADNIVSSVLDPVESIISLLADIAGFKLNACLGDFSAEVMTDGDAADDAGVHMVELCNELPLATENNEEWSVVAFEVGLPNVIAAQFCEGLATSVTMSACFAVSTCDVLPSFTFVVDSGKFDITNIERSLSFQFRFISIPTS